MEDNSRKFMKLLIHLKASPVLMRFCIAQINCCHFSIIVMQPNDSLFLRDTNGCQDAGVISKIVMIFSLMCKTNKIDKQSEVKQKWGSILKPVSSDRVAYVE